MCIGMTSRRIYQSIKEHEADIWSEKNTTALAYKATQGKLIIDSRIPDKLSNFNNQSCALKREAIGTSLTKIFAVMTMNQTGFIKVG